MHKSVLIALVFAILTANGLPAQSLEKEEGFEMEQPVNEDTPEYVSGDEKDILSNQSEDESPVEEGKQETHDTPLTHSDPVSPVGAEPGKEEETLIRQSDDEQLAEVGPGKEEEVTLKQSDEEPPVEIEPGKVEEISLKQSDDEPPVEVEPGKEEEVSLKQSDDEPPVEVEPGKVEEISLKQSDDEPPVEVEPGKDEETVLGQSGDKPPMEAEQVQPEDVVSLIQSPEEPPVKMDSGTEEEFSIQQPEVEPRVGAEPGDEGEAPSKQSYDQPPMEVEPGKGEEVSLKQSEDEPPVEAEPNVEEDEPSVEMEPQEEEEFIYEPLEYLPYSKEEVAREDEVSQDLSEPTPPDNLEPTSETGVTIEHSDPELVIEPPASEENEIPTEQSEGGTSGNVKSAEPEGLLEGEQATNVESDREHLLSQPEGVPIIESEIIENEGVAITHQESQPVVELEPGPVIEETEPPPVEHSVHTEPPPSAESVSSENLVENIIVEPKPDISVNEITDTIQPESFESEDKYNERQTGTSTVDSPREDGHGTIDVAVQEITFDTGSETPEEPREAAGIDESEYTTSSSHENSLEKPDPNTASETWTPVYEPEIIPEVAYTTGPERSQGNVPHDYGREDRRLIYTPETVSREEYQPRPRPYEPTTSSYERRMSQIDEYRREEDRRKRLYESQNIYRRPDLRERENAWPRETHAESAEGCGFDYLGRKLNCSSKDPFMSAEMRDPHQGSRQYIPPPQNFEIPEEASEDALEDEMAMRRANPVYLSMSRWPVRNVNHLGPYPRHPACRLSPKWGVGPEELSAWFYSQADGRCLWFSYAGHGGNANRFYSRASCNSLCVFDQDDLCLNVRCGYPGSRCILRGDDRCKAYARSRGKDLDLECPPDQPVCRARRALIAPEYDAHLVPGECMEEVDAGSCLVKSPQIRYHYDSRSNSCRSFYFHGCGGNNNRFESMQECMNHCAL